MNYSEAKSIKSQLDAAVSVLSVKLNSYPKGNMGLTPDSVKSSNEWKQDRIAFDNVNSKMRAFNQFFIKNFKKEYAAERRDRLVMA